MRTPSMAATAGGDFLSIPLAPLIKRLPEVFQKDVKSPPRAGDMLKLPVEFVLLQMPRGEVKLAFAELRQASPPDIFAEASPNDMTDVSLPLDILVPLLSAKHLNRRSNQKKLSLGEEIAPVFNVPSGVPKEHVEIRGVGTEAPLAAPIAEAPLPARPAPPAAAPIKTSAEAAPIPFKPAPPFKSATPAPASQPAAPALAPEGPIRFTPPPAEPSTAKPKLAAPTPTPIRPVAPSFKPAPLPGAGPRPAPLPGVGAPKPAATLPAALTPLASDLASEAPKLRLTPDAPAVAPAPVRLAAPPKPAPPAPTPEIAPAQAAADSNTIHAAMWALMIAWPEALRKEIATGNLTQRMVAFPTSEIEPGIRSGRVNFPWQAIQAWIQPPIAPGEILFDSPEPLPIPLQVIAPLFMAAKKPVAPQRKIQIAESIPDVFSGKAQAPEPGAAPAAATARRPDPAPVAAAAPVAPHAPAPVAAQPARVGPVDIATVFGQPDKQSWTPVELVQNTSRLEGVAGALIALPDGLQVASDLPSSMNGDLLAAFLPQIFARITHYTNEIKLGEPSNISFATNQQIWQINKAGNVFLLTVGRPGEALPVAHINAVATQLERQSKTN